MEDTLSLQLNRPSELYAKLVGDAVVALASLSVMLASRRRLACNGTVESVSRLLGRAIGGGGRGGGGREGREGGGGAKEERGVAIRNMVRCGFGEMVCARML